MENFIVSARKYRPDTFVSVVGQASITSTLKNAIKNNHLAHAYLFCGPRGVGKTTCARIFAKTINCKNLSENAEPCNACESCNSFNTSRSYNIHELDAASNNSVDDIRTLIEQVRIPPQVGNYSVYIIDEVHMLSQQAFNAFLKTLEEPPAHAIFILATTEKHKIIPTILSRCQIFDFNRIKIEDIVSYLEHISKLENITYETEAFNIIAQKADGAMRDALSIYDQIVSFSNHQITYQEVIDNLNILDYEYYFKITDAFLEGNISTALTIFNEILDNGFDGHNFINNLSKHFRDVLVCKDPQTVQLLDVGKSIADKYLDQAKKCSENFIFKALDVCSACDMGYKLSKNQRLHVEIALIKLCSVIGEKKNSNPDEEQLNIDINTTETTQNPEKQKKATIKEPVVAEKETEKFPPEPIKTVVKSEKEPEKQTLVRENSEDEKYSATTSSIKNALKNLQKPQVQEIPNAEIISDEDSDIVEDQEANEIVDEKKLIDLWGDYTESLKEKSPRMYSTLKRQFPKIDQDNTIKIEIQNNAQLEDFKTKVKPEMLSFLRKELKNNAISISEVISEKSEDLTNKRYFTEEDKLKRMVEKNPALNNLKQHFNLDFE
ncbi:MAG: DNA polymerase III subunit gamma/tau [Bacteroidales bacterium]|nr:DNA polymerase III subunit gamma/tau [Bacteroidales bacterium]